MRGTGVHFFFFLSNGRKFERLREFELQLHLPRVSESQVRSWFGGVKGFPKVNQLASIAAHGAPVHVYGLGDTNITAALEYGNHSNVTPYTRDLVNKIHEDVRFGRALVIPLRVANAILGLRLPPLAVVASTSRTRIIHDLTFASSPSCHGVNADTDFATAPPCRRGHVLRDVVRRIAYLRRKVGVSARILLSKMDVKDAFRQVAVEWERSPTFGYVFRDLVVVDRRLQFGWRSSPGFWCLFASALEHSHVNTSFDDVVTTEAGREATAHVGVTQPANADRPAPL